VWCAGLRCDKLQVLCVLCSEVFCVIIMPRKCLLRHPNNCCYVCGEMTFQFQRRNFTPIIKKCYELYFGCKVGDQDKSWASRHEKYNWKFLGDLKAIVLLVGLQLGYTKVVAFYVSGIVDTGKIITSRNSGLNENRLFQDRKT